MPCESASLRFTATELWADDSINLGDRASLGDEESQEPEQEFQAIRGALKPVKVSYSLEPLRDWHTVQAHEALVALHTPHDRS